MTYLKLLYKFSPQYPLDIWSYCVMGNHVHLLAIPGKEDSLSRGVELKI